jgi:DNA-binding NtrC family response regulator
MSISQPATFSLTCPPVAVRALSVEKGGSEIVGSSGAMKRLRLQVRRIGPHFRMVLITGEAGTGKELVARALHAMRPGTDWPFVVCHAARLEDVLVECEGAVGQTGVISRLMHSAPRGTLFLKGVSEMSLQVQGRLLRVLKEHELLQSRLETSRRMDLRMIASAREDLKILVSTGRFQPELYQRLAMVDITLPPLRGRMDDLPELARCFLNRFAVLHGKSVHKISDEAMDSMQRYHWPGNVNELENALRNGVLQSEGEQLESRHLSSIFCEAQEWVPSTMSAGESVRLQDVVDQHVLRVLKQCGGNKLRAAEMLGISRSTLYRMLDTGLSTDRLQ